MKLKASTIVWWVRFSLGSESDVHSLSRATQLISPDRYTTPDHHSIPAIHTNQHHLKNPSYCLHNLNFILASPSQSRGD